MSVRLHRDPDFRDPFAAVMRAAIRRVLEARTPAKGAEDRVARALDEKRPLDEFRDAIDDMLEGRRGGFAALPEFVHPDIDLSGMRVLEVGAFRGVFLVGAWEEDVLGLLFTCAPHDIGPLIARFPRAAS